MADLPIPTPTVAEFHGSHGTTRSRLAYFKAKTFPITSGMRGNGFYAWREGPLWKELAVGWYRFRRQQKLFDSDENPLGVVVYVVAKTSRDRYLDITVQEIVSRIAETARRSRIDTSTNAGIGAVYEFCILEFQREAGVEFDVIETTVGPPGKQFCPEYNVGLLSSPRCYIMRRAECISIRRTEEFG